VLKELFVTHIPENFSEEIYKTLIKLYFDYIAPQLSLLDNQTKSIDLDYIDKLIEENPSLKNSLLALKENIVKGSYAEAYNIFQEAAGSETVLEELRAYLSRLGTSDIDLQDTILKNVFVENLSQRFRESSRLYGQKKGTVSGYLTAKILQEISSNIDFKNDIIQDFLDVTDGKEVRVFCSTTAGSNIVNCSSTERLLEGDVVSSPTLALPGGTKIKRIIDETSFEVELPTIKVTNLVGDGNLTIASFYEQDFLFARTGTYVTLSKAVPEEINGEHLVYDTKSTKISWSSGFTGKAIDFGELTYAIQTSPSFETRFLQKTPFSYTVTTSIFKNLFNQTIKKLAHPVGFDISLLRRILLEFSDFYSYDTENYISELSLKCWDIFQGTSTTTNLLNSYNAVGLGIKSVSDNEEKLRVDLVDKTTNKEYTIISDFDKRVYLYSKDEMFIRDIKLVDTKGILENAVYQDGKLVSVDYKHYITSVNIFETENDAYISDFLRVDYFNVGGSASLDSGVIPTKAYIEVQYFINDVEDPYRGILELNLYSGPNSVDESDDGIFFEPRTYTFPELKNFFNNPGNPILSYPDSCRLIYKEGITKIEKLKERLSWVLYDAFEEFIDIQTFVEESLYSKNFSTFVDDVTLEDLTALKTTSSFVDEFPPTTEDLTDFSYSSKFTDFMYYNTPIIGNLIIGQFILGPGYELKDPMNEFRTFRFSDNYSSSEEMGIKTSCVILDEFPLTVETSSTKQKQTFMDYWQQNVIGELIIGEFIIGQFSDSFTGNVYRNGVILEDGNYSALGL